MKIRALKELKQSITIHYAIALGLIALLSTVAFYNLSLVLEDSHSTAYIVNISGKQRMLSQHIALDSHRLHQSQTENKGLDSDYINLTKQNLKKNMKEMSHANEMLSNARLSVNETGGVSPVIYEMYFGEMNLAQRVKDYIVLAQQMLNAFEHDTSYHILKEIDLHSEILLVDLNEVVKQYQLEGEEKLRDIKQTEAIVWAITLFVLLLEVIFIFQPMVRSIVTLSYSEQQMLENLQAQVELRTLHLQEANHKLEEMASHDPLTGLYNRLHMEEDIENIIEQHSMHGAPYAVLMLDIDWFKEVNDNYGHDVGDFVLMEISGILKKAIRQEDRVYRAGGEEFVILLNRLSYDDGLSIAEKIRRSVENHIFEMGNVNLNITISGGLYHSSLMKMEDQKTIMKLVDMALYDSKLKGRNRIIDVKEESHTHIG